MNPELTVLPITSAQPTLNTVDVSALVVDEKPVIDRETAVVKTTTTVTQIKPMLSAAQKNKVKNALLLVLGAGLLVVILKK